MTSLSHINWFGNTNANLKSLNDVTRNRFFDQILKTSVAGKRCLDIGHGAGLLFLTALHNGAESVVVYEENAERYALACEVVNRLNLSSQVTLINQEFSFDLYASHEVDVVLSESMVPTLWNHRFFQRLPRTPREFFPAEFWFKLYAQPVAASVANALINDLEQVYSYCPGVDFAAEYLDAVNSIKAETYQKPFTPIADLPMSNSMVQLNSKNPHWAGHNYKNLLSEDGLPIAEYSFDITNKFMSARDRFGEEKSPIDFTSKYITLCVDTTPWQDCAVILIPRMGLKHGNAVFEFDDDASSALFIEPKKHLTLKHSLEDGKLSYIF
jgi:hypothetical protein